MVVGDSIVRVTDSSTALQITNGKLPPSYQRKEYPGTDGISFEKEERPEKIRV